MAPPEPEQPSLLELPLSTLPSLLSRGRRRVRRFQRSLQGLRQRVHRLRQRARQLRRGWRGQAIPPHTAPQPLPAADLPPALLETARPWLEELNRQAQCQPRPVAAEEQG